ncbi:MAG: hypothetical protein JNM80_11580 [Phycisphaerae bacterium]|nr:hypothetical protein [Phycisphaerae bacterium]
MTTEQTMRATWRIARAALLFGSVLGWGGGCETRRPTPLTPPAALVAPYDTSRGPVLWAVAPLRNESGTTSADALAITDKVVAAAAQVRGVSALPLNRTIAAMRALGMSELKSPADAKRLAGELGADVIVVGSITAYDPYDPPKLGLALALYTRPGPAERRGQGALDPRKLTYQPTDYRYFPRSTTPDAPGAVVSEYFDGRNHQVLMDVKSYSTGRHDPDAGIGWRRYLASMDLFCDFGSWQTVKRLLDHEWLRLAQAAPAAE